MWSSNLLLFAPVFVLEHVVVEASPLTRVESLDAGTLVKLAKFDVSNDSQADIPSSMPLQAFGTFRTLSLEDVIQDPTLVNTTAVSDNVSTSSIVGESKLEEEPTVDDSPAAASYRQAFVDAIACLANLPSAGVLSIHSTSRYEDFVQTHQKMTPEVHGNGIFILWHRYYVYTFEQALRTQCDFTRPFPWWDETKDSGKL